jgi:cell division protein FtsQ
VQKYINSDKIYKKRKVLEMARTGKMQDFRKLNLIDEPTIKEKKRNIKNRSIPKKRPYSVSRTKSVSRLKTSMGSKMAQTTNVKTRTKSKSHIGLALFFFILVIIGVGVGFLLTPTFNTNLVMATDGINVTKDELLNKANIQLGTNIFKINTWKIEEEILKIPYIKDVKVSRKLPDTIAINYKEREPYLLVKYLESYLIMDMHGYILELVENKELDFPIIYGIDIKDITPGLALLDNNKLKYDNIVLLLETMKKNNFNNKIDEINYEDFDNIKLVMGDIDVDFGKIEKDINIKISYMQEVLKNIEGKKGRLDLSGNYLERTIFEEKF